MSLFEYHTKVSCSIIIPSVAWMSQNLKGYTNEKSLVVSSVTYQHRSMAKIHVIRRTK